MVVPGGDPHPCHQAQHQDDEAEDDEAGGGVGGGSVLPVLQGAHGGGHAEVLVTPLKQEVLQVKFEVRKDPLQVIRKVSSYFISRNYEI